MSLTSSQVPFRPTIAAGSLLRLFQEVHYLASNLGTLSRPEQLNALRLFERLGDQGGSLAKEAERIGLERVLMEGDADLDLSKGLPGLLAKADYRGLVADLWGDRGAAEELHHLVQGRAGVDETVARQEEGLWRGVERGPLVRRLDQIGRLRALYTPRLRSGGGIGLGLVRRAEESLADRVFRDSLEYRFVRTDKDGVAYLPPELRERQALRFPPGVPRPSVIRVGPPISDLGWSAWFHIPDLVLFQGVVSDQRVLEDRGLLRSPQNPRERIQIALDRQTGSFWVWDGYNRLVATLQEGFDYILGGVLYHLSTPTKTRVPLADIQVIPHAEYKRLAEAVRAESQQWEPD